MSFDGVRGPDLVDAQAGHGLLVLLVLKRSIRSGPDLGQ
jgi:hypothetical protein